MTRSVQAPHAGMCFGATATKKKKKTHPDTKEDCDETDGEAEEEEEHEEPGAPVQPVAEAHHPHVLLQRRREKVA